MRSLSPLRYRLTWPTKLFYYFLILGTLLAPVPFVFFKPGIPDDVSGRIIEIRDTQSYKVNGKLFITSILVTDPDTPVFGAETIFNWARGENVVLPRKVVYPPIDDSQRVEAESRDEMTSSQVSATAAALRYLGYSFIEVFYISDVRNYSDGQGRLEVDDEIIKVEGKKIQSFEDIRSAYSSKKIGDSISITVLRKDSQGGSRERSFDIRLVANQEPGADSEMRKKPAIGILVGTSARFPIDVKFNLEGVGGPSAGMIFALGIVEKLTPEDLIQGRAVAGTGTITASGKVGPIGGIEEKMIGAARSGATIFLAPRENCPDIKHVPKGLKVIPISTLGEAIAALRAPANFEFPTC